MLPGYNHNIRYKEKLFHVQTEDNGLDDPDLVTQVFLGGQIVAIERSSYGDVLVDQLEEKDRNERIKDLMQEQHKKLLKNLIRGEYDGKIEIFLRAEALRNDAAAMENPSHTPNFEALDAAILAAEQNPITPESLLAPDAVLELSTSELFAQEPRSVSLSDTDPRPKPPVPSTTPPQPFLVEDLKVALRRPEGRPDSDRFDNNDDAMLGMIEQQMHQQLTWSPSKDTKPADPSLARTIPPDVSSAATLEEPVNSSAISHIQRARELAKNAESASRRDEFASHVDTRRIPMEEAQRAATIGVDEMPTKIGRRKPTNPKGEPHRDLTPTNDLQTKDMQGKVPDTLVDYGLPAALRREIDEEIARRATTPAPEPTPSPQKNDGRAFFRPSAPKPEGRYSSVRKTPVDRPFDAASTPVDSNLDKIPKKGGGKDRFPSQPDTMIEVDRAKIDAEAARLRNATPRRTSRPAPPDPKASPPSTPPRKIIEKNNAPNAQHAKEGGEDPKRPSILVVERSLDEVILSYLYDEMAEK